MGLHKFLGTLVKERYEVARLVSLLGRNDLEASSSNARKQRDANAELGQLAEAMVAEWLKQQGWQVLGQRWHCRWGEIDVVAVQPAIAPQPDSTLVVVEVKARGDRNWDGAG